jgi:glycosyltransferase involved in cell wall biosynthesis
MPCYQARPTLDLAVESILNQTYENLELLAVDDGSDDGTYEQLQSWARRDRRVRPLRLPHGGIVAALQSGLAQCEGALIARMDADDHSHPDRLARQVEYLQAHPEIALAGCLVQGFPSGAVREGFGVYMQWLNSLVEPDDIEREIYIESPLAHPSVMLRREWLERVGGYQEHGWAEDYDLWLRMHLAGARFAKLPQVLLDWREHPDRLTRTDSRYSVENFLRAKAHYLMQGPLQGRDGVIVWGAGQMGRRLAKHLDREGAPLAAFLDIDPKKIGRQKRGRPIVAVEELPGWWKRYQNPVLLAAVGSRGARALIRERLNALDLREGRDWWAAA